jgi:hypothetical protein
LALRRTVEGLSAAGFPQELPPTMIYDIEDRVRSFELIAEKVAGGLRREPLTPLARQEFS